jgi:hypothetical protein
MAGLQALAGTADAGLQEGFEKVLTSIRQAHMEGLQRPASASRGAHRTNASPAAASPAATSQARPPAGGASRKARKAKELLASYLFGAKGEQQHLNRAILMKHLNRALRESESALWGRASEP